MRTAAQVARRLNHKHIDTEHILLALVSESSGLAASVLCNLRHHPVKIAMQVERLAPWGTGTLIEGNLTPTAAAEIVIESAATEACELCHDYVGTEHLLLGLLREEKGLAARVLTRIGLTKEDVRREILRVCPVGVPQANNEQLLNPDSDALSDTRREFFLALYRSAVAFYKPRIERRTGIHLGEIAVWDHSYLHQHVMDKYRRRVNPWLVGVIRVLGFGRRLRRYAQTLEAECAKDARKHAAFYYRSAIYVSFDSGTPHEEAVATAVVHELSHALWERIEGERLDVRLNEVRRHSAQDAETYKLFVEGYATYADQVWFLDLYPASIREMVQRLALEPGSVYSRGLHRIKILVQQHGPQILLEIPKRWHSF